VRPPDSKLGSLAYELRVFNVSANPNFAANTPEHESAPLIVSLVAQRVYTLTVLHDGTGLGHVDSTPAGINCGADCLADFGQSFTVDLVPRPAQGSRFDGWESSCTAPSACRCTGGPTATCSITLNGTAATATAKFVPRTPPPPMAGCPGPRADAGLIFVGLPSCATTTIDMHPQAFLACDVQGFFCCEPGGNDQRCVGGGKRQFPADCMRHGNRAGPPPTAPFDGCYTRTGP
jgi:hypothetical protein